MTDRLTINDCREAGYCVSGVRRACESFGVDFRTLVKEGVPLSKLESIEDANLQRAIAVARKRIETDG